MFFNILKYSLWFRNWGGRGSVCPCTMLVYMILWVGTYVTAHVEWSLAKGDGLNNSLATEETGRHRRLDGLVENCPTWLHTPSVALTDLCAGPVSCLAASLGHAPCSRPPCLGEHSVLHCRHFFSSVSQGLQNLLNSAVRLTGPVDRWTMFARLPCHAITASVHATQVWRSLPLTHFSHETKPLKSQTKTSITKQKRGWSIQLTDFLTKQIICIYFKSLFIITDKPRKIACYKAKVRKSQLQAVYHSYNNKHEYYY